MLLNLQEMESHVEEETGNLHPPPQKKSLPAL